MFENVYIKIKMSWIITFRLKGYKFHVQVRINFYAPSMEINIGQVQFNNFILFDAQ